MNADPNLDPVGEMNADQNLDPVGERNPDQNLDPVGPQGCGSGSAWIRINFPSWIRIQQGKI